MPLEARVIENSPEPTVTEAIDKFVEANIEPAEPPQHV
jgi:hypothetical protein